MKMKLIYVIICVIIISKNNANQILRSANVSRTELLVMKETSKDNTLETTCWRSTCCQTWIDPSWAATVDLETCLSWTARKSQVVELPWTLRPRIWQVMTICVRKSRRESKWNLCRLVQHQEDTYSCFRQVLWIKRTN